MATTELTGAEDVAWDLGDLYAGIEDPKIESDVAQAEQDAAAFRERYHGTVAGLDAAALAEAVAEWERIESALVRPLTFAHLVFATNMADPARGALVARLGEKAAALDTQLLFFGLEWAALEDDAAEALLADPALDHWRHHLRSLRKFRPYLLSEPEEQIVTEKTVSGSSAWARLYEELLGALRVTLDGEEVPLEPAMAMLYDVDRDTRRAAAEAITEALGPGLRTRTFVFNTILLDKSIDDRLRGYPTWLSSRNLANETTDEAVEALIHATTSRYDLPQRYYRLKARLLGLDRLEHFDRFAPISSDAGRVPWDEARAVVVDAYSDFSEETGSIIARFFDDSWIDGPVRPDKRTGAFCATTIPGVHPYVLMNYTGDRRSVLTLAHELGHGLHGVLAQPLGYVNSSTPLTTAETASVFGEALTFERLLGQEDDPHRRLDLLAGRHRGRDRHHVPPDRDEPLRGRGPHRAPRARRDRAGAGRRALARLPVGALRRRGRARRLHAVVELHPAFHRRPRLRLRVRVRLPLLARDLPPVRRRGRVDGGALPRPAARRRLALARGARPHRRTRPDRSVHLGERARGARRGIGRGRAARGRARPVARANPPDPQVV